MAETAPTAIATPKSPIQTVLRIPAAALAPSTPTIGPMQHSDTRSGGEPDNLTCAQDIVPNIVSTMF